MACAVDQGIFIDYGRAIFRSCTVRRLCLCPYSISFSCSALIISCAENRQRSFRYPGDFAACRVNPRMASPVVQTNVSGLAACARRRCRAPVITSINNAAFLMNATRSPESLNDFLLTAALTSNSRQAPPRSSHGTLNGINVSY